MRIAFDLDDTLIPGRIPFPLEPLPGNPLRRWWATERLRRGSPQLINQLWNAGHEVWVYTTSLRGPTRTKLLFRGYGTRVGTVINESIHRKQVTSLGQSYKTLAKFPPAYQIDLLIDDSEAIVAEGKRFNYDVLKIQPDDEAWIERICERVGLVKMLGEISRL